MNALWYSRITVTLKVSFVLKRSQMRSFRKGSLCDETAQSTDSMEHSGTATNKTTKAGTTSESVLSGITGLVRRSFPRPLGRSSRNLSREVGDSHTFTTSFRSSMHLDCVIDEKEKVTEYSSIESRNGIEGNLGAFVGSIQDNAVVPPIATSNLRNRSFPTPLARCSTRNLSNASSGCSEISFTDSQLEEKMPYDKGDNGMASELSILEDMLIASSKSPTKLLSRSFPMTSTHGSSIGSMSSYQSSSTPFDDHDQSSNCNDDLNADESLSKCDRPIFSKGEENTSSDIQIVCLKACSSSNNVSKAEAKAVQTQGSNEISKVDITPDCTCDRKANHNVNPRRRTNFLKKLIRREK